MVVLLTRQAANVVELQTQLATAGMRSICLPMFAIESLLTPQYITLLQSKMQQCDLAVCVSRNAAELLLPHLQNISHVLWAAIGAATARCLHSFGITGVLFPAKPPFDSSALMQHLKLSNLNLEKKYIMVFTGEQGDNHLPQALERSGAFVDIIPVYKRVMPPLLAQDLRAAFNIHDIGIILITCLTSLVNLIGSARHIGLEILDNPLLVVSPRIYAYAAAQGFKNIYIAKSIGTKDIIASCVAIEKVNEEIN